MTITVTAPNGASVQFPDGTDHDTINSVMTQNFHPAAPLAPDIGENRESAIAALRGIPIAGAYVDKAAAALNAVAQPYTETGLSKADNFSDRMDENEKTIKAATDAYETSHPIGTTVGKVALGAAAMVPAALAAPEILGAGAGLPMAMGANAAIGGADAVARGGNIAAGALTGAALPAAFHAAGTVAGAVARPFVSNVRAAINPEGYADSQIARAVSESGQTPQQLGDRVAAANAEGTPLALADALGKPGQDMLSTVTRSPGQGATDAAEFLQNRQSGQGRRVVNALTDGFDSRQTPDQLETHMTAARGAQADRDYGAVRDDAQPVDVTNVLDHIDQHLAPFGVAHDRIAPDGITGRMLAYRRMLGGTGTDLDGTATGGLNDFNAASAVRNDLADEIQRSVQSGDNNKARVLGGVRTRLDQALEDASPGFRQANANFRQASQNIDAIGEGRNASMRGRTEDIIPQFNALQLAGQRAFRTGYVDPLIQDARAAAPGANKARPLMNDAFRDEAAAMAPRGQVVNGRVLPGMNVNVAGPQMTRRIANENTMFETHNRALGGSKTADNFNNDAAMGVDPTLIGHILSHNYAGALHHLVSSGANALTGNTAAVRAAVGRRLLDRGVNAQNLNQAIGDTIQRIQFMQQLSRGVNRVSSGALATLPAQKSN